MNDKGKFPLVIVVTPVHIEFSRNERGATQVQAELRVRIVSLLDVNPRRCVRQLLIERHFEDGCFTLN